MDTTKAANPADALTSPIMTPTMTPIVTPITISSTLTGDMTSTNTRVSWTGMNEGHHVVVRWENEDDPDDSGSTGHLTAGVCDCMLTDLSLSDHPYTIGVLVYDADDTPGNEITMKHVQYGVVIPPPLHLGEL